MSNPVSYYLDLVTSEYRGSPKYLAYLAALLQKMDDVSACADSIDAAFDLDTAEGVQLDILGQIIGIKREVPFQPNYGLSPILSDSDYRVLLKCTIAKNQWDGIQNSLSELWESLFSDIGFGVGLVSGFISDESTGLLVLDEGGRPVVDMDVVQTIIAIHDNHFMDMDVFVRFPQANSIFSDLTERGYIVPRPEGVLQRYYLNTPLPLFGFDYDDPYVSGFDQGQWWSKNTNRYPGFGFDSDDNQIAGLDRGNWWSS